MNFFIGMVDAPQKLESRNLVHNASLIPIANAIRVSVRPGLGLRHLESDFANTELQYYKPNINQDKSPKK
jgi:hypothetical protein